MFIALYLLRGYANLLVNLVLIDDPEATNASRSRVRDCCDLYPTREMGRLKQVVQDSCERAH